MWLQKRCLMGKSLLTLHGISGALLVAIFSGGCGEAPQVPAGQKRFVVLMNNNSPFWDAVGKGVQKAAAEFGVKADLITNDGTDQGQISMLRQFGTQTDIAAVGISVLKADVIAIAEEMKNLQEKGIHVITIDSDVNRDLFRDARAAFVGTNNREAGKELGVAARALKSDGAKYVTFVGQSTAQNAIERVEGFQAGAGDGFAAADHMEDGADRTKSRENVRNAMSNHPDVDMLVGIWSYNAPAIVDVVKERNNRDKYAICVFDAEPVAIEAMQEGNIDVMMVQNPYEMGYQGVRLMKALADKDEPTVRKMMPRWGEPEGDIYDTGLRIVVPDNQTQITQEIFGTSTDFFKLGEFRGWLAERDLEGS
jgi:ribose transport system substrate-binding protein